MVGERRGWHQDSTERPGTCCCGRLETEHVHGVQSLDALAMIMVMMMMMVVVVMCWLTRAQKKWPPRRTLEPFQLELAELK